MNTDNNALTIYTKDGTAMTLPDNVSVLDFLPQPGAGGSRLPKLNIGQPGDDRMGGIVAGKVGDSRIPPPQFFLSQSVREGDSRETVFTGPFPAPLIVVPIGYISNPERSYYASAYKEGDTSSPDCHSYTGVVADARFQDTVLPSSNSNAHPNGVIAGNCMYFNPKTQRLEEACPYARWKREVGGKSIKPPCSESWIVAFAVLNPGAEPGPGEWTLCEAYFKSISANDGRKLVHALHDLVKRGIPLYSLLVKLEPINKNAGNSYAPVFVGKHLTFENNRYDAGDHVEIFQALTERWAEAVDYRKKMAAYEPNAEPPADEDEPNAEPLPVGGDAPVTVDEPVPSSTLNMTKNNGKKNGSKSSKTQIPF